MLGAVERFVKIEQATSPKDEPAPVYLLDEICDLARSSPEAAASVAERIVKRLAVKSPVVKFKALRLVKHLCTKGCSQFQRCMQRQSTAVRELVHYRGEPDPFKGDAPNAHVRELAKDTVEVLFNSVPPPPQNASTATQGRIQGFGSDGASFGGGQSRYGGSGSGGSISSSSRPVASSGGFSSGGGFGGNLAQLAEHPIAQRLTDVAQSVGGFLQPKQRHQRSGSYGSQGDYQTAGFEPPSYTAGSPSAQPYGLSSTSVGSDFGGGGGGGGGGGRPFAIADGGLNSEQQLVDDFCAPGGLRAQPDAGDLRSFVESASGMDGLNVAELLRAKMETSAWQSTLRALCALEAVLQQGSTQACGEIAVMFQSEPTAIRNATRSTQPSVRAAAARVLKLLLNEDVEVGCSANGGAAKAVHKTASAPAVVDLLGGVADTDAAPSTSATAGRPAAAAPAVGLDDLLGDFGPAPAAAGATAAAGGGDLFGGLSVAAPVSAPAVAAPAAAAAPTARHAAPLDDLFSGISLGEPASQATSHLSYQTPPPQASASLLGFYSPPGVAAPATAAASMAFGGDLLGTAPGTHPTVPQYSAPQTSYALPNQPLGSSAGGFQAGYGQPGLMAQAPLGGPHGNLMRQQQGSAFTGYVPPLMGGAAPAPQPFGVLDTSFAAPVANMKPTSSGGGSAGKGAKSDLAFDFISAEFKK